MSVKVFDGTNWVPGGAKRYDDGNWVDIPTYTRTNDAWVRDADTVIYGFTVDESSDDSDTSITYTDDAVGMTPCSMGSTTFDYGSWESVLKNGLLKHRPCMLRFDGTVAYYLDPDDYTKKEDGTPSDIANPLFEGNAMIEFCNKLYYRLAMNGETDNWSFQVSNKKINSEFVMWSNLDCDGNLIDHFYLPIYNGTSAPTYNNTATYAVDDLVTYNGAEYKCTTAVDTAEAFDSSKWNKISDVARLRSLSGVHLTPTNGNGQTSGQEEIDRAAALNTTSKSEWSTDNWCDRVLVNCLLFLISHSFDVQAKFGRGIDSGSQAAKEAYVTGTLNDKGLFWGSTSTGTQAVKVFGMENWYSLVWRRTRGLMGGANDTYLVKMTHSTKDGTTVDGYNTTGTGYLTVSGRPGSNYVRNCIVGPFGYLPKVTAGTGKYKDYFSTGTGYALVGGYSSYGAVDGPSYFYLGYGISYRYWTISASPSCKPCKNK